jgi:hypothetical protein
MKRGSLWIALVVICALGAGACGSSHHHVTPPIPTNNFVYYAAGTDSVGNTYSVAGVVTITADGNNTITAGVQDFNDGDGLTSTQPTGDSIVPTGSSLSFNPDGSGNALLTLVTNNANIGNAGTVTFALSYANANHALIAQFDDTATSMGSFDLQTLPSAAINSVSFSFTSSGVDADFFPVAEGGVFSLDASGNVTGSVDINDGGSVTFANSPSEGTVIPASDTFGRGTVTGSLDGTTAVVNFYIVNSEVIRLIDVDTDDTAVGSAYGQGATAGSFSPSSIGQSVFNISGIDDLLLYNGAGQFFTLAEEDLGAKPRANKRPARPQGGAVCSGAECVFEGTADVNESVDGGAVSVDAEFDGTYVLATNGYGSFTFVDPPADTDLALFGVYAVDPTLNILDPNNSAEGLTGGALLAEMDTNLVGTGVLIPQVEGPAVSDIAADVVFGAQGNADEDAVIDEFDLLGASSVDAGVFAGEGFIDDPAGILNDGTAIVDNNSTFDATFIDDGDGIGRYLSGDGGFVATSNAAELSIDFTVTAYDANGDQLFWVETDDSSTWGGSIQASTFTVPDAKKAQAKPRTKTKKQ